MNKYESICDEAKDITENNRMKEYGHPIDKFSDIARFWNSYLVNKLGDKKTINHKDVAIMMTLLKIAREQSKHKRDNLVDAIGYLRNCAQIEEIE